MIHPPAAPARWRTTRVDRVASVQARIGWKALTAAEYVGDGYPLLATPNIKSGEIDFHNVNRIPAWRYDESPELQLRVGDVLLAKDGNTLGITNVVTHLPEPVTVNGSIAVLRPHGVESRFLRYWLASEYTQSAISALKGGMGVPHLFQWDINRLPVLLPDLEEQRRIADFLDTETTRLDTVTSLREKQASLLDERWQAAVQRLIADVSPPRLSLRRVGVTVTTGPFGTVFAADSYVRSGVPMINPTHITDGRLRPSAEHTVAPTDARRLARHALRRGDLVVSRKGDLGRAARVRGSQDGWICGSDCIALHTAGSLLDSKYLGYLLRLRSTRDQLLAHSNAATMPSLNEPSLLSVEVPVPGATVQRSLAARFEMIEDSTRALSAAMRRQIAATAERRRALITAAVTGQLDVTTARGGLS